MNREVGEFCSVAWRMGEGNCGGCADPSALYPIILLHLPHPRFIYLFIFLPFVNQNSKAPKPFTSPEHEAETKAQASGSLFGGNLWSGPRNERYRHTYMCVKLEKGYEI